MDNNVLNLDKFQVTMVKHNYQLLKPIIAKRNKAQEKLQSTSESIMEKAKAKITELEASLGAEIQTYNTQIETLDKFTREITKQTIGKELSSEECIHYLEHPEEFETVSVEDLDAEEDQEWENRIKSGELKEVA